MPIIETSKAFLESMYLEVWVVKIIAKSNYMAWVPRNIEPGDNQLRPTLRTVCGRALSNTCIYFFMFLSFYSYFILWSETTLNYWMMVERCPYIKEEVGGSVPDCEISTLLDKKLVRWSTASRALALACRPYVSINKI